MIGRPRRSGEGTSEEKTSSSNADKVAEDEQGIAAPPAGSHKFVLVNVGLAGTSIWRRTVSPELKKRCGVPGGITAILPAVTSRVSLPTVMVAQPSIVNATSTYGCVCNGGPCPGLALTM